MSAVVTVWSVDCEAPCSWLRLPGVVSAVPALQDIGRVQYRVTTTNLDALLDALDEDNSVIQYEVPE